MMSVFFDEFKIILVGAVLSFSGSAFSGDWSVINSCIEKKSEGDFINVIKIKSGCSGLKIVGSKYEDKGMTTSEFVKKYKTDVAVNANFSRHDKYNSVIGFVVSDGVAWPDSRDSLNETMFYCDRLNNCKIESLGLKSDIPKDTAIVVSGWQAYENGSFKCPPKAIDACFKHNGGGRHPRTAIGIGKDKNIYIFSVDGRQPMFEGLALSEFDGVMKKYSILSAVNLDGGGSTTLVVKGVRVSRLPANQKVERVVPNHIGFTVDQ